MASVYVYALGAFLLAVGLTWSMRRFALARGLIDHPNARSSHVQPTPRGGGVAIVVASALSLLGLGLASSVDKPLVLALLGGGLPIAWIGFMDDRRSVSVRVRFAVHLLAACWAMYALGGLPPLQLGTRLVDLGMAGDFLGVLAIVWALNLFNFMDGIDGIAASEAVLVAAFGGLVLVGGASVAAASAVLAASAAGFLVWNWPPAKIFMGDVGSGYLGYCLAVLAVASARHDAAGVFVWLTISAVFFADATVTLLRRLCTGERVLEAHSSHAYQVLARRWQSHRAVTLTVIVITTCLLLPLAWWAAVHPESAALVALGTMAVLAILVLLI